MSYRDDAESARARAERLERELEQARDEARRLRERPRRRPRFHGAPFLTASVLALIAASVAAMPRSAPPPPMPAPRALETAPPPTPPAPLPGPTASPQPAPARFFYGEVARASGDTTAKVGAACTVSIRKLDPICLVTISCGDYRPFPGSAFASCTFDEQGLPHGQMHFGTPGPSPTDLAMDHGRLSLASDRGGHESVVEIALRPDPRR